MTVMIIAALLALMFIIMSRLMATVNTGLVVPTASVLVSDGPVDPLIIYLTAAGTITPGDNVVSNADGIRVARCAALGTTYTGTANRNTKGGALAGTAAMTTNFTTGDTVPIITGSVQVRKIADAGNVTRGVWVRIGSNNGAEVADGGSIANKYFIGRSQTNATSGNPFIMHQM